MALSCYRSTLRGSASKNNGDFYYLNCLHSIRTKKKLEFHKRVCEKKEEDFYNIVMPSEDINTLEINQNQKSNKASFIIKADL